MKILFDLELLRDLSKGEVEKIEVQIKKIVDENYEDYFVKTLVQEILGHTVEIQFDYTSNEVYVREC